MPYLRILNLHESATEEDVKVFLRSSGVKGVRNVFLAVDTEGRKNCGFAFVNIMDQKEAERAAKEIDGTVFHGHALHVDMN